MKWNAKKITGFDTVELLMILISVKRVLYSSWR